jgi:hypothetical protein
MFFMALAVPAGAQTVSLANLAAILGFENEGLIFPCLSNTATGHDQGNGRQGI